MKKIIKRTIVLLIVTLTILGMVACTQAPIVSVDHVDDGYEPNVSGEITWTFYTNNAFEKKAATSFIKAFESAYPNASVKHDSSPADVNRVAGGTIGDVFYFLETETYKYGVVNNGLMPLEGYVSAFDMDLSDVYIGVYEVGKVDGHLYYVARDYNSICFDYNLSKLRELNLDTRVTNDWTWGTLRDISKIVTEATADENEKYYGANIDLTYSPVYVTFFESGVGSTWCDTEEKKITFNDENGQTLKAIKECIEDALAGYINPGISSRTQGDSIFKYLVHPNVLDHGKRYDSAGIDWDMVAFPGFGENGENRRFGCGSSGFGVYNRTQNQDTAAAFALYFFTEEGQLAYNGQPGASVPLVGALKDSDSWRYPNETNWVDKNWDAFVYEAHTASIVGEVVNRMPYEVAEIIDTEMRFIIDNVMNGRTSVDDAFMKLETKCNEKWSTLIDY